MFFAAEKRKLLLGCFCRDDIDEHSVGEFAGEVSHLARLKFHRTGYQGEERIVLAALDVLPGMVFGTALADNDVAYFYHLTAVYLDAEALGYGITA